MIDRLRVWMREEAERAAERKAARKPDPPHVTVPESLCRATELASWMAYFALVYFLLLYTFDIARDRAGSLHLTQVGTWTGDIQVFFPYIVGFIVVAVGIPYVAKIAIPTFTRLDWREAPTEKAWSLFIAVAVSLVVIAGTFTVQGDTILERDRAGVVAVQQTEQEAAVLGARIADVQHALDEMTRSESVYIRTAASMSPEAYDAFVEQRRGDWQYDRLVSYRATSVEAARLRQQMSELRAQQARQTVAAQVQGRVTTASNGWIGATLGWLEGARAMLLSFVMDIVCLIMPLIALRLRLKRNQQLAMGDQSGWADEAHRIEDLRADEPVAAQPMKPPREVVRDAETGEELIKVQPKPHWRKRKGKPQRVEPEALPDEAGVAHDGGGRVGSHVAEVGSTVAMPPSVASIISDDEAERDAEENPADHAADQEQGAEAEIVNQPDLPELTPEEELALAQAEEQAAPEHIALPNGEGVIVDANKVAAE